MAVTSQRTRLQLRQSVGLRANALEVSGGSNALSVTGTSSADAWVVGALTLASSGSSNEHRGKWGIATAGSSDASSNVGLIRRVSGSTSSDGRLSWLTSWAVAADTSQEFELWSEKISPIQVHEYLNEGIQQAWKKSSIQITDSSLHTGGGIRTFTLPAGSSFTGIKEVEYRESFVGEQLTSLDDAPSSGTSTTIVSDSEDFREGEASARINMAAGVSSAATIATDCFDAVDMRGYTHLEFWAKANAAVTSSGLRVQLNEGSTNRETLTLSSMGADSWNYQQIALANPELDSGITRFVMQTGASDMGSATVWFDDVEAVLKGSERWTRLHPRFWGLGRTTQEIVLERDANVPYSLLRLTGVRAPNLLSNDSDAAEVSSQYLIHYVMAKMAESHFDLFADNPSQAMQIATRYEQLAERDYMRIKTPSGIRWLSDSA